EISNTSSINSIDMSIQKSSHWSTTCNYCNEYWYKGSSAALENHLATRELDTSTSEKLKLNVQSQLSNFIK
ncbi:11528_t:CDS:2, partial [Gigaspora margarita]